LYFLEKIFIYGALVWLSVKSGRSLQFSIILSVVFLNGIEIAQMFLQTHVSEITDPLLAVIMGLFLYFLDLREIRRRMDIENNWRVQT
jgi:glycopeptide antibiotics resistance protein